MDKGSQRKAKLLHLQDILLEETDDEHGLTMPQLIERLQKRGIGAERKALYDDLETLKTHGLDIVRRREPQTEYAIGVREFELPELLLLADAVQSSRFLTKKKSEVLIKKLRGLTSMHHKSLFDKSMHVEGRIKMQNESIYLNVYTIQEAIRNKKKITFQYFEYGIDKEKVLRREGKRYVENPIDLVYKDEYYYLITYNDSHEKFLCYRVDRMEKIDVVNEAVSKNETIRKFRVEEFTSRAFSMFDGEETSAALVVDKSLIGPIIDRFGREVLIFRIDDTAARIHVRIMKSDTFFGWVAQFGVRIVIESPPALVQEYKAYLEGILEMY